MKKDFVNAPHWSFQKWISVLAKGGGHKKRFQYCLNPNYPHQFLYLRAIQGHSGSTINTALQDNVLLPESFTEYIYHVGNETELWSKANHGLIAGGVSLRTGRWLGRNPMRLVTSKNRDLTKNTWKRFHNTVFWCNLKLAQQRGLQFIKHGQTQLSSATHCLQSSLRKRYS